VTDEPFDAFVRRAVAPEAADVILTEVEQLRAQRPRSVWVVVSWDAVINAGCIEGVYSTREKAEARVDAVRERESPHATQPQAIDYGL
jgi:hypothetical protein